MVDISERSLEQTIEATLLRGGPDAYPTGEGVVVERLEAYENAPGGYRKRKPDDYDKELCPDPVEERKGDKKREGGISPIFRLGYNRDSPASISSGSETKASKSPTIFPTSTFSSKKSSKTSKPLSSNSAKSPRTWVET